MATVSNADRAFARRLVALRRSAQVNQNWVADMVGLPRNAVGAIERGARCVSLAEAVAIAAVFEAPLSAMVGEAALAGSLDELVAEVDGLVDSAG